ncbi:MAG: DNA photolyase family protein [Gammaproteobacteria bacterium]|nr:DNA photolyase family protein [Gammaproteobacteria bacterium]MBU1442745.1 DNA photolyase family protein [Gammaproteobacteria bacterium]MBU2286137.1 DNA photolyase family protein [Gammaproteobacteria bacterium]MBU2407243.1 DNA photolyase family protein [Gammaproteobacteria bacterium]
MPPILLAVDKTYPKGLMWLRRDLRLDDNAALYHALRSCRQVLCVFVFDTDILDELPRADRRVEFIRESLVEIDARLRTLGSSLIVRHAAAAEEIPALARALEVQAVFANRDDEPAAMARDTRVFGDLANAGISFQTFKDQTVFDRDELLTQAAQPYSVFTPYKRAWLSKVDPFFLKPYPTLGYADALAPVPDEYRKAVPTLADLGFEKTNLAELEIPTGSQGGAALFEDFFARIDRYHETRDFPAVRGPSYMSVHLRFGTVSIRRLAGVAHQLSLQGSQGAATWLSELIWRDFYFQILAHHPRLADGKERQSFRPEYDKIQWHHGKHADGLFEAWCNGQTGYPLIDAAMAQINQSGYMHNRLRMVVASFLCKDLGLDWRRGERYFEIHLNDFELSSNNGGWQWASSSGCDAQPYFRIFNPVTQSERFDPEGKFIRRYLPQLAKLSNAAIHAPWTAKPVELVAAGIELGKNYPKPVVDHAEARERTLQRYAAARPPAGK